MGKQIMFTTVKSAGDNRVLEKDDKGYYKVTLGALNVFNSAGEFYTLDGVEDLFTNKSSILMRRLKSGNLKGEVGHPKFVPGMRREEFYGRNMRVEETNTSHHVRDIMLEETNIDSGMGDGSKVILVMGWLKPSGVHGDALQKDLDNPEVNVNFSVRSFTKNTFLGGTTIKRIVQLVTWDWVTEPGISHASKWKTLGVESVDVLSISIEEIGHGDDINECFNCSLESEDERAMVRELITNSDNIDNVDNNTVLDDW